MRFSISALALFVLQKPSDAFSPQLHSSRVAKTSSTSVRKKHGLYAQRYDDDNIDESVNNSNKSSIASFLFAGAALQLSTSKVSATHIYVSSGTYDDDVFPVSTYLQSNHAYHRH